jgi:hypothetical protein
LALAVFAELALIAAQAHDDRLDARRGPGAKTANRNTRDLADPLATQRLLLPAP